MPKKATPAKSQRGKARIASKRPSNRSRPHRELYIDGALAMVLALGPIGYQMLKLPHRMALALVAWGICLSIIARIVWLATGGLADKLRLSRRRKELSLDVPLAFAFAFAPSPYRTLELPHYMLFTLFSWTLCLAVIGRIVWL